MRVRLVCYLEINGHRQDSLFLEDADRSGREWAGPEFPSGEEVCDVHRNPGVVLVAHFLLILFRVCLKLSLVSPSTQPT